MAKPAKPPGRPSKYKPEYCEALVEHMKTGLSFESFAGLVAVNQDTLHEWKKKHPEFSEAQKNGSALSLLWWEKLGKAAMVGEAVVTPDGRRVSFDNFNTTMWIFAMKNRHGWRDRHDHEHSGKDGKAIETKADIKVVIEDYTAKK